MKIRAVANGNIIEVPDAQGRHPLVDAGIYEEVDEEASPTAVAPLTTEMVPVAVWADPPPKQKRRK